MIKSKRFFNPKTKVTTLNSIFFNWIKQRKNDAGIKLELYKELSEIKWAGGTIGQLDISTLPDLGPFSERKSDLLQREIHTVRTEKNEKIELKDFAEALKLDEKENLARSAINRFFAYKVFKKHACFYLLDEYKIGFLYRGDKTIDSVLESELRKVFSQIPTYSQSFYLFSINKLKQKINVDENTKSKLAA
ncbi:MAG: hypothetical protein ACK5D5_12610 [Bacteroidota bacterium]|jgi:hypothetical protein